VVAKSGDLQQTTVVKVGVEDCGDKCFRIDHTDLPPMFGPKFRVDYDIIMRGSPSSAHLHSTKDSQSAHMLDHCVDAKEYNASHGINASVHVPS